MIAKSFVLAKTFYPITRKSLRDHEIPLSRYPHGGARRSTIASEHPPQKALLFHSGNRPAGRRARPNPEPQQLTDRAPVPSPKSRAPGPGPRAPGPKQTDRPIGLICDTVIEWQMDGSRGASGHG